MTKLALFGAGGKMGMRLGANLAKTSEFETLHVEVSDEGRARVKEAYGVDCVDVDVALDGADVIVLAVPDTHIGKVAAAIVDKIKSGAMLVCLDGAAPFAGHLPERADITYFVSHPCHPPIWNDETEMEAKRDYFGGIAAKQGIVNTLVQGPEEDYVLGEKVGRAIYAPVARSHRVTLKQFALLEPGLSETVNGSLMKVLRMAMDEVVRKGVSYDCARDFLLGHMNIMGAVMFDEHKGVFSDAANKAIEFGIPVLMKDDWLRCFDDDEIAASVDRIT
ncbi:phosphogluconate dehydrogenase C-terminal domain-containing protein [Pseudohalocynthiibacter aestuariivivens]|jgi:D-apionate oxidoisomerase|uniref:Phosphogluconate dehydrogenase C-terminal domain-containing protein n=1 Tax=Pseudohalocynthiibacter aestuariivivens TaxID=1591409 RepID=A0ABV5JDY5_9RHOB|nr:MULTISPECIES: phosphogluconate dehydrogenase C-terminal domain-containing protein [Pseudohalocynthiibacter]MBS9718089.1 NAD(P)-binding domain-containing protein [Pseudohalocynthiibacter aestuariivivens]MCK0103300.1 NAD(P)-binding domain-containing protein [Pseudohalocynthiibacter sp. F2068]